MQAKFTPFPTLMTDRLILRRLLTKDDALTYRYRSDKANFKYVDMSLYTHLQQATDYIAKMNAGVDKDQWIIWAIADKKTDDIIGTISLWSFDHDNNKAEVGYGLYPGNVGHGYMSEALRAVTTYGIDTMVLSAIEAYTHVDNQRSRALLERCGYKEHSLFTETETSDGEPIPMVIYTYA